MGLFLFLSNHKVLQMNWKHILPWIIIFGLGFYMGSSFKNADQDEQSDRQATVQKPSTLKPPANGREISPVTVTTSQEKATIDLFENAAPSVAFITTKGVKRDYWSNQVYKVPSGSGSGFIWDKDGHIVTNFHVVKEGQEWEVTLSDQSVWEAELVGYEPRKDLAILKINAPAEKLVPIPVGTSSDLRVGQSVYAIGNPFGLDQTLTTGIVSALGREIESLARIPIRDVIQTDAAINPGNSGGPLLDSSGRLIGVNTAIYSPSGASVGIGFSIPVDVVNWVIPDLIEYGKVQRPMIGIELVPEQYTQRWGVKGAMILDVTPGSGAEKAGLIPTKQNREGRVRFGDIITAVDGVKVVSNNDLILALEAYKPDDMVLLSIIREEKEIEISLPLGSSL